MSNTNNCNNDIQPTTMTTTHTDLDDLVSQLRQTIDNTDWLLHNISTKLEQQNPKLAKQWQEVLKNSEINETTEQ
jgi:2C-methyl-D-erythritol 2,4-cyclodiphosphate synthase